MGLINDAICNFTEMTEITDYTKEQQSQYINDTICSFTEMTEIKDYTKEQQHTFDIENQIADLQQQQLQTIKLLEEIKKQLSELSNYKKDSVSINTNESKSNQSQRLQIGDKVRILNPRRGQPSTGFVAKLTTNFVFIDSESLPFFRIKRAFKNVQKESE